MLNANIVSVHVIPIAVKPKFPPAVSPSQSIQVLQTGSKACWVAIRLWIVDVCKSPTNAAEKMIATRNPPSSSASSGIDRCKGHKTPERLVVAHTIQRSSNTGAGIDKHSG